MSTVEVRVPDIGDAKDVSVVDVLVQKGSKVRVEDPLITLESEKASMDVPSPVQGVINSIAIKKGDAVSAGALIATVQVADEAAAPPPKASAGKAKQAALLLDSGIIRNRLKIDSTVTNARCFIAVQREFGSFDRYLWSFVDGRPVINRPRTRHGVPTHSALSDRLSKDLKKRGFRFVGTTIIYAYLQAVGVVNDHTRDCFLCRPAGGFDR